MQVIALACEAAVGLNTERYIQVAAPSAVGTLSAMPFNPYLLPIGNTGGYCNGDFLAVYFQYTPVRSCSFGQCQLQCGLQVVASLLSAAAVCATKQLFEKIAETTIVAGAAPKVAEAFETSKTKLLPITAISL